jgi:feruloyl esterase
MLVYAPKPLPAKAPLVVVLHGCTQTAEAYADGAGWLALADRLGFCVVAAEQKPANNPNRCFNWFEPEDVKPGGGEACSIRQMVEAAVGDCDADPARVYVTGLSAGGAMTMAVLSAYPALFAGGGVIAGLPYRAAEDVMGAFAAMYQPHEERPRALGDRVRDASRYTGPWPRLSIWQGDADTTVSPDNAGEIAKQWANVHDIAYTAATHDRVDGQRRSVWSDPAGAAQVELYRIRGMGHGTPLASLGPDGVGTPGPFLLEEAISSTWRIAEFWGLTTAPRRTEPPPGPKPAQAHPLHEAIAHALTEAGLMKR